jgi:hypothetical protein
MQALPAPAESLSIVVMGTSEGSKDASQSKLLYLNIGLRNGVLLRTLLDKATGDLSDTRTRYLGSRPVKLFTVKMQGSEAVSFTSIVCAILYFNPWTMDTKGMKQVIYVQIGWQWLNLDFLFSKYTSCYSFQVNC